MGEASQLRDELINEMKDHDQFYKLEDKNGWQQANENIGKIRKRIDSFLQKDAGKLGNNQIIKLLEEYEVIIEILKSMKLS